MPYVIATSSIAAAVFGLWAAYCWRKASVVSLDPKWRIEPGNTQTAHMAWIAAIIEAFTTAADLNRTAAGWTAVSVLFGVIAVVGEFTSRL